MTNPDLIKQLESLRPTEGEWHAVDIAGFIQIMHEPYYEAIDLLNADECDNYLVNGELASLAPQMRLAILEIAKEIDELKEQVEAFKKII